jgi:hypothetical protein
MLRAWLAPCTFGPGFDRDRDRVRDGSRLGEALLMLHALGTFLDRDRDRDRPPGR